jgi:excisionase family DNA binding protein
MTEAFESHRKVFAGAVRAGADDADELLRAPEVARFLRVTPSRAYQVMASGQIPVVRIGRSVRVSRRQLEAWIERQSQDSIAA